MNWATNFSHLFVSNSLSVNAASVSYFAVIAFRSASGAAIRRRLSILLRRSAAELPRRSNSAIRAVIRSFRIIPSTALILSKRCRPITGPASRPRTAFDGAFLAEPFFDARLPAEPRFFMGNHTISQD